MNWLKNAEVVIAVVGGVIAAIVAGLNLFTRLKRRRQRKVKDGLIDAGNAAHEVYAALLKLMNMLAVDRVMLIEAHNGGGIPRPGSPLKISVRYEVNNASLPPIRDGVQDHPVDRAYIQMILELTGAHFMWLRSEDMPAGWLRDLYTAQNVQTAALCVVGYSESGMYYLALQAIGRPTDTERFKANMDLAGSKIASLFDLLPDRPPN